MKNKIIKLISLPLISTIILTPIVMLSTGCKNKDNDEKMVSHNFFYLRSQVIDYLINHASLINPTSEQWDSANRQDILQNLKIQNFLNGMLHEMWETDQTLEVENDWTIEVKLYSDYFIIEETSIKNNEGIWTETTGELEFSNNIINFTQVIKTFQYDQLQATEEYQDNSLQLLDQNFFSGSGNWCALRYSNSDVTYDFEIYPIDRTNIQWTN